MSETLSNEEREQAYQMRVLRSDLERAQNDLDESHHRALFFEKEVDRLKAELHKLRDEGLTW